MKQKLSIVGLIGLILGMTLSLPRSAFAGGYYVGDVGTRGTARSGAFIAAPNSLLSMHYNPAGLALIKSGLHFEADLNLINYNSEFKRRCPCLDAEKVAADTDGFDGLERDLKGEVIGRIAKNTNGLQDVPYFALAYGFDWNHLTIGIAGYGPQGARRYRHQVEDVDGISQNQPHRYSGTNIEVNEAYGVLGVAASPIKGLRFGFGLQLYQFWTKQELTLWANSSLNTTTPEDTRWDIPSTLNFESPLLPNWNFGVSYEVMEGLTIGASILGKRSVVADGIAKIELPEDAKTSFDIEGSEVQLEVDLPPIWRFGVQYAKPKFFTAEVAFVLEAWRVYDLARIRSKDIYIVDKNADSREKLTTIDLPYNFTDTWSLRVGGEFDMFAPIVTVAAGYFYEPSAIPNQLKDVSAPDLDKQGVSFGLSSTAFGVTLSLAAQYIALSDLTVENSQKRLVGPLDEPTGSNELLTTIANGDYSGDYLIVSASLSAAFDEVLGNFK
jgi:long-chain fatty acid transport protein